MNDRHVLIAFIATLTAIVILYGLGAILAFQGRPVEALGLGGAGTGLIGVLGTFRPRTQSVGPNEHVNVTTTEAQP